MKNKQPHKTIEQITTNINKINNLSSLKKRNAKLKQTILSLRIKTKALKIAILMAKILKQHPPMFDNNQQTIIKNTIKSVTNMV